MAAGFIRRIVTGAVVVAMLGVVSIWLPAAASAETLSTSHYGELDCNGESPVQQSVKLTMFCTDIRGFDNEANANTWDGRFYDNGTYIGHDEPDMTFLSSLSGSGNNVTWTETLGTDPAAAPTDANPGSDVSHWFEDSPAPWFSMAICDSNSYPQTPCTPNSDSNAPTSTSPGGGSAFMEMQFYPPGFAPPWVAVSCDDTHWCGALTIDSLECTLGFATCNPKCEEPVNFGLISKDGVPAGPPSPQDSDAQSFTPNRDTLLMNPGDRVRVHMYDAPVPGEPGQRAFKVVVTDLTTGQSGSMQASARNGFKNTSFADCSGTPHNFEPEYNSAKQGNIVPWAALQTDISTEYETGHFEPCTSLSGPETVPQPSPPNGVTITTYKECHGPYEKSTSGDKKKGSLEVSDAPCYYAGTTMNGPDFTFAPIVTTGCLDELTQNGDLDFDGTPYWTEWPTSTTPGTYPGSFQQALPTTGGAQYAQYFIQTDLALSESTCTASGAGCTVPPPGLGHFYPYWTRVGGNTSCRLEFGNVSTGQTFGQDAQYGTDQAATLGYPEFEGPVMNNSVCQ
jgi:hypothetical protein